MEPFDIQVEDAGPCRKRVRVVVPAERVHEEVESAYATLAQSVRWPGFRPGRAPRPLLERRFGEIVMREVKETLVQTGFSEACSSNGVRPLGPPTLDLERISLVAGSPLEFEVTVDVRPEVRLPDWGDLEVERHSVSVSEAEVDEALTTLRRAHRRVVPDREGGVPDDGLALARVEFVADDAVVLAREGLRLLPATPIPGADPGAFAAALVGRRAGESFDLPVRFPPDFEVPAVVGREGRARVTVQEVLRFVDPTDEELGKALEFDDAAALRSDLQRNLAARKEREEDRRVEDAAFAELLQRTDFDVPERIVEKETAEGIRRRRARLEAAGVTGEELGAELASFSARTREQATAAIKTWFLIEAIAREAKLFVTEDDLRGEFRTIAERNRASPDEVRAYYEREGLLGSLRAEMLETKVRRHVRERVGRPAAAAAGARRDS